MKHNPNDIDVILQFFEDNNDKKVVNLNNSVRNMKKEPSVEKTKKLVSKSNVKDKNLSNSTLKLTNKSTIKNTKSKDLKIEISKENKSKLSNSKSNKSIFIEKKNTDGISRNKKNVNQKMKPIKIPSSNNKMKYKRNKYKIDYYDRNKYGKRAINQRKVGLFPVILIGSIALTVVGGIINLSDKGNNLDQKQPIKDTSIIEMSFNENKISVLESNIDEKNISKTGEDTLNDLDSVNQQLEEEKSIFEKDIDLSEKVDDYLQTDLGEYIRLTSEKYGFDGALSMAHLYHESWGGKHIDVLPENYDSLLKDEDGNSIYVDTGAITVPGDDGFNVFNGSNYGIGQLTLDGSVVTASDITTGEEKTMTLNIETALNVFSNIEVAMMLNQDNLDRIHYLLEEEYKQCVADNVEIREDQILNASFLSYLQCYNFGLSRMIEIYDKYSMFDKDGTFNFDNLQKGIDDVYYHPQRYFGEDTNEDTYGSNTYINSILAICPKDKVDVYFNAHKCYYTFNIRKSPDKMVDYSEEKEKLFKMDRMIKYEQNLSKYACKDSEAYRLINEKKDIRTDFFRDIDRIIYSLSYTRYIDKTQVFSNQSNDHISKRITHVQFVSKIARTIGRALGLNEDLIEAASLGHDLGHAPFGHNGEAILNEISLNHNQGYFNHNIQSVRVLKNLENNGCGSNITVQVMDAIMCHNGEKLLRRYMPKKKTKVEFLKEYDACYKDKDTLNNLCPMTLEGCVVRVCDVIGYIGRDLEDGIRLGLVAEEELPVNIKNTLGSTNRKIINTIVLDVINNSLDKPYIEMSEDVYQSVSELLKFNYENIYYKSNSKEQINKYKEMFNGLFNIYLLQLNNKDISEDIYTYFLNYMSHDYITSNCYERIVIDYISGMTDDFFIRQYEKYL